jgi:hypothetical protein
MLMLILLLEAILVLAVGAKVLIDEKHMDAAFERWMGVRKQIVYRIPLRLVIREEIKEKTKHIARHRYVH